MRLVTFRTSYGTRAGRVDNERVTELPAPDVGALLADTDWYQRAQKMKGPIHDLQSLDLAPPVVRPGKIICLGLNYETHIREMGREMPLFPTIFAKYAEALIGGRDPIVLPRLSNQIDWEGELAFVIGRSARHVNERSAWNAIAGYTILNDISVRDWQWRTTQWLQGKSFEATTPVGPVLVTPDDIDHARDLVLRCKVDGMVMQEARTSDLVFGPASIVAFLSELFTLRPGDLVSTGTPGGVGAGRDPEVFLQPGQVVRTSIEQIGELVNDCVSEAPEGDQRSSSEGEV